MLKEQRILQPLASSGLWPHFSKRTFLRIFLRTSLVVLIFLGSAGSALSESLTLRVSDVSGQPGERVAVILRTYAPRPVSQGQVCLRARLSQPLTEEQGKGIGGPFSELESVVVFSEEDDAGVVSTFEVDTQTAFLEVFSPSASINSSDGPMAVFFFRLRPDLEPGTSIELTIEPTDTNLVDALGEAVDLELRSGELAIRAPGAARELEVEGEEAAPGAIALVAVATSELFPMAAGQASLLFDPDLFESLVSVRMDPRHGQVLWSADSSRPGRLTVSFSSPDLSLNSVPGEFIQIEFLTSTALDVGTFWPLILDPGETWVEGGDGELEPLELTADGIQVIPQELLFGDGFESQDLSAWSFVSP